VLRIGQRVRGRLAAFCALAYALCVLAPHAALAFNPTSIDMHCLEELGLSSAHKHGVVHVHNDGSTHVHHHDLGKGNKTAPHHHSDTASCCGLFGMTAIAADARVSLGQMGSSSIIAIDPADFLGGESPPRIHRPPIA
jgi:hypothetical protein